MKPSKVREAVEEAHRFLARAGELLKTEKKVDWAKEAIFDGSNSGALSGACKRASLDLTRALAAMRKA